VMVGWELQAAANQCSARAADLGFDTSRGQFHPRCSYPGLKLRLHPTTISIRLRSHTPSEKEH
jgi:hypothetical protein